MVGTSLTRARATGVGVQKSLTTASESTRGIERLLRELLERDAIHRRQTEHLRRSRKPLEMLGKAEESPP